MEIQQALFNLEMERQKIQELIARGVITEAEGEDRILGIERERLPVLQEIAERYQQAAVKTGDSEKIGEAKQTGADVRQIGVHVDETGRRLAALKKTAFDSLVNGLGNFLSQGIQGAKNLGEAIRNMAKNFVAAMLDMIAQMLAFAAIKALFKGMGFSLPTGAAGGGGGMATGGIVRGPGTGTSDSIPVWLSNREYRGAGCRGRAARGSVLPRNVQPAGGSLPVRLHQSVPVRRGRAGRSVGGGGRRGVDDQCSGLGFRFRPCGLPPAQHRGDGRSDLAGAYKAVKLGAYTFDWNPDVFTLPQAEKSLGKVKTYSSIAFFSWGLSLAGKEISIEWDWMGVDQYERLRSLFEANASVVWDPEAKVRLFHGAVTNGPFVPAKTLTGATSGATGTIGQVVSDTPWNFLVLASVTGSFHAGETVTDNSVPAKSAVLTSVEAFQTYNVEILSLDGKLFEEIGTNMPYRKDIRMRLLVLGIV